MKKKRKQFTQYPLEKGESYVRKYNARDLIHASKEEKINLGMELLDWVQDPEALCIDDFPLSRLITPRGFRRAAKECEYLDKCIQIARGIIGNRLTKGVLRNEYDRNFVSKLLPLYNEEYKELQNERIKEVNNSFGSNQQPVQVVMPSYHSDQVPEKQDYRDSNE